MKGIDSTVNIFHAVFTYLSSGILLSDKLGSGIIDPCERGVVDVTAYLTSKQRSDITHYAQYILNLIVCEKFDEILYTNQTVI